MKRSTLHSFPCLNTMLQWSRQLAAWKFAFRARARREAFVFFIRCGICNFCKRHLVFHRSFAASSCCVESFSAATRYCDPFCFSGPRPAFSVPVSPSGSTFFPRLFSRASQVLRVKCEARKSFHLSFFLFRVSIRPRFWTSPSTNPLFHKPSAITSLVADVSIAFCTES